jgi:pimeloyl-ACP methyl ester carboxylesterase
MLKILCASLALTTACATVSDKPATSGGSEMPAQNEPRGGVKFASSSDGTRIAFEGTGQGPALVIVGGALSHRGGGKPLVSELQDHFTVYIYDRRGRGDSGDNQPYAVDREIEDLGAVIDQAGAPAFVYGVSSGAALSLQAAAKLGPQKVRKLALYEPPYGQGQREYNEQKERTNQLVRTGKPGEAAKFFLSAIGMPPPALEAMTRSPEWQGIQKLDFTLTYDYAVLGDGAVPDAAKAISVPTLVINGEKTLDFIPRAADRLAELIPNAQRETLPGQAHQAEPKAVAPVLVRFFGDSGKVASSN